MTEAQELAEIIAELERRKVVARSPSPSLEHLLTSLDYFGLSTASPLQRAICRLLTGEPIGDLAKHPDVVAAIGNVPNDMGMPVSALLLCGIRSAKSLIAAAAGVWLSQTCDLSQLGAGETARVPIVSLKLDLAQVVRRHLEGNVLAKPKLRALLVCEPTADTVTLRHPSGRPVEIMTVAGSKAGGSLVGRWLAGIVFDEAPRMVGADEGVINLTDMRESIAGRLLPGALELLIGSPWAPFGPAWELTQKGLGKPSRELVVVKAPAYRMNPVWWTAERCAELKKRNPDAYHTDVEAEFHSPEESLFPLAVLDAITRQQTHIAPEMGYDYRAAMDPGTRGNAWTLVVTTLRGGKKCLAYHRQWIGSKVAPLSPKEVLAEVAEDLKRYGITLVETDQYAGDALRDIAADAGLYLVVTDWTATKKVEVFTRLKTEAEAGLLELSPDPQIRADLIGTKRKITQNGVTITFTKTADGRHCDYAPAVALAMSHYFDENMRQPPPKGTQERADWEEEQAEEEELHHMQRKAQQSWWERRA